MNKVFLVGHLGRDPEIKYTKDNKAVANFTMATTEKWKDKNTGEYVEMTEWHRVVAFSPQSNYVEKYLKKGAQVLVEGKIETRKWTDNDGNDRFMTEIKAHHVEGLGPRDKPAAQQEDKFKHAAPPAPPADKNPDDDLPF